MALENVYYPHMMPEDIPVWERWLAINRPAWDLYNYDVRVGGPVVPGEDVPENLARMWIALTQKRIDVVCARPGEKLIIEVKRLAGWTAIGQILGYYYLYQRDFPSPDKLSYAIVAQELTPDTEEICAAYEIPVHLV